MTPEERIENGTFKREVLEQIGEPVLRHGRLVGTKDLDNDTTLAVFEERPGVRRWVRADRARLYPLARMVAGCSGYSSPVGFHFCYAVADDRLVTLDKAEVTLA